MMREMKKKLNPRNAVGVLFFLIARSSIFCFYSKWCYSDAFIIVLYFKLQLQCLTPAFPQELMPWDHPFLSGVLRAERWKP